MLSIPLTVDFITDKIVALRKEAEAVIPLGNTFNLRHASYRYYLGQLKSLYMLYTDLGIADENDICKQMLKVGSELYGLTRP